MWVLRVGKAFVALHVLAATSAAGCGASPSTSPTSETVGAVSAIYVLPDSATKLEGEAFFDQPWPNDLRAPNGVPSLKGFYNPRGMSLLTTYVDQMDGVLDGFSPIAPGYLRFDGPIDSATLPASPADAQSAKASVQLLDVDPSSPDVGTRRLVQVSFRRDEGVYFRKNTLAFLPAIGFPLRPRTRYALVVTDALRDESGLPVVQSAVVSKLVGGTKADASTEGAALSLAPTVAAIEAAGIARQHIVHLAVFTTGDPTRELALARDAVAKLVSAPTVVGGSWALGRSTSDFSEYTGRYGPSPNFQAGTIPFAQVGDGGGFVFDRDTPVLQSTFDLRFSLTVPRASRCAMPAAGYPIVLYAHGTGGDYESFIHDGTAGSLAQSCLATMGVDQIFHGDRQGAPADGSEAEESILFFNFQNPLAARTNGRQSALDEVQRARLFTESHLVVPASVSVTGQPVLFDSSKVLFFGHSQGGLNGPLFTAVDPSARGAVFSGSGSTLLLALLEKTSPKPSVAYLVRSLLLGLSDDEAEEETVFHPALGLLQAVVDPVDPANYARLQATEPRSSFAAKSIYMTEGINSDGSGDTYAPPATIEAHALGMGLPLQLPREHAIAAAAWGGPRAVTIPAAGLSGDLGAGRASGVLAQWAVPVGDDGHFVVFDVTQARDQAAKFLQNLAADPKGRVPPP